jgi:CheY-like chemotaxis protein
MAARLRVMVVDDEESVRDTMRIALNSLGHSAETVSSAEDALAVFDSGRFDIVITDLFLPGMNGDQLARIVKREDGEKPVILLTAYPPREIPPDVDSVLLKPFSLESLREILAKVRS